MPNGALDVPQFKRDTIIERNWSDISSSFTSLKEDFEDLENNYGYFILRKLYPDDVDPSSSKIWLLKLDRYANIDSLEAFLWNFNDFIIPEKPYYLPKYFLDNPQSIQSENNYTSFELFPQPVNNFLCVKFLDNTIVKNLVIQIYNPLGNIILKKEINKNNDRIFIDTKDLPSGIYFIRCESQFYKFIKL